MAFFKDLIVFTLSELIRLNVCFGHLGWPAKKNETAAGSCFILFSKEPHQMIPTMIF